MHNYYELVDLSVNYNLNALDERYAKSINLINQNPSRVNVIALQMINLQKAIIAIGIFSMFESQLQDYFINNDLIKEEYPESCKKNFYYSFKTLKAILKDKNEKDLLTKFEIYDDAINTLKHGKGSGYYSLLKKENRPFKIKKNDECFYFEGDVDEINSLIEVDNKFVNNCSQLLKNISLFLFENY